MLKTILTITFACILSTVQGMPPCAISNPSVSNAAAVTVSSKATCDHEYKLLGKTCKRLRRCCGRSMLGRGSHSLCRLPSGKKFQCDK